MINRRQFIQLGAILTLVPKQLLASSKQLFTRKLTVPKLELGKRRGKNVYFNLTVQSGISRIFSNKNTPTLGINQTLLGVTLRANKGDTVNIQVKNSLNKTTTLHWHGMKLPAKADGGPHQPIKPSQVWRTQFDIIQPAATLWYHSHQLHKTAQQVYHGLAGLFIIDDKPSSQLNLPDEYGVDDLPIIIQDRDFNRDGSLRYLSGMMDTMMGKKGQTVLVNGVINPTLIAKKSLLRLRLLNGSNARTYHLEFTNKHPFYIIASDGGLLEKPIQVNSIELAAAERAEILIDVSYDKNIRLKHYGNKIKSGSMMGMMGMMSGNHNKDLDIFNIDAQQVKKSNRHIPKKLSTHHHIAPFLASYQRILQLKMQMGPGMMFGRSNAFTINGRSMDINRIDEVVKAGSIEIWTIENASMLAHPFHIHNVQFKILSRSQGKTQNKIQGHELGYKDVVLVHARERVQVIMKFPHYKDKKVPYMYHCHILEHEDRGMMGQFLVV